MFVSMAEFEKMRDGGELLEWAEVFRQFLWNAERGRSRQPSRLGMTFCSISIGKGAQQVGGEDATGSGAGVCSAAIG